MAKDHCDHRGDKVIVPVDDQEAARDFWTRYALGQWK
jgi:hypothetical protein